MLSAYCAALSLGRYERRFSKWTCFIANAEQPTNPSTGPLSLCICEKRCDSVSNRTSRFPYILSRTFQNRQHAEVN